MKQRVFVTGATGGMGFASLKEMLEYSEKQDIVILARDSEKNRSILKSYTETPGLEIFLKYYGATSTTMTTY